ncbi:MAG: isoprenylcysteine carboxylmethyltransferase family protein [Chloroflexota bacterium]|nr:isoprenylcysteine carboxylmethyltransferase family protein [Chloroflexota bacterium]
MAGSLIDDGIIGALWLVFLAYWAFSAIGVKRDIRRHAWLSALAFRIVAALVVLLLLRASALRRLARALPRARIIPASPVIESIGVALCAVGIAFAIWARWHLGRNWSSVPTLKEGHELVTAGPYARVRHPIYTGMLTAALGTALTIGGAALIAFVACCVVFLWRVPVEERLMQQQFPDDYPAYRAQTKALIPFVF